MRACKYVKSFGFCPSGANCDGGHPSLCVDGNACSVFRCEMSHTEPLCTSWSTCTVLMCPRRHGPGRFFQAGNFLAEQQRLEGEGCGDYVDETDAESENGGEQQMNNNSQSMCCSPSKPCGTGKRSRDPSDTCKGGNDGAAGMGMGMTGSTVLKKRLLSVCKDAIREDDQHGGQVNATPL
jgi:hypothetical protein